MQCVIAWKRAAQQAGIPLGLTTVSDSYARPTAPQHRTPAHRKSSTFRVGHDGCPARAARRSSSSRPSLPHCPHTRQSLFGFSGSDTGAAPRRARGHVRPCRRPWHARFRPDSGPAALRSIRTLREAAPFTRGAGDTVRTSTPRSSQVHPCRWTTSACAEGDRGQRVSRGWSRSPSVPDRPCP